MKMLVAIALVVLAVFLLLGTVGKKRRKHSRLYEYHQTFSNPEKRQTAIDSATFELRPLLNKGEFYAYQHMCKLIDERNLDLLIFPQIPLISYIKETSTASSVKHIQRGMRPDFTIFDNFGRAVAVVEINGTGHHAKNDAAQAKVLQKAGVTLLVVDTTGWKKNGNVSYKAHVTARVESVFVSYLDGNN